ncbi:MAG: DJ-1 family glyoxalase III [Eubacteriales bacterium]|jgi:4-methyl-5(b-hydroxyethyl)-thiazole monophosphate biosynthesis
MAKVFSFWADGLEEVEALTPVDVLRRAGNDVTTVSIMGRKTIHGSHGIDVAADQLFEETDFSAGDLFILPGGGKGTQLLSEYEPLMKLLKEKYGAGKNVAAICAAPSIFGKLGIVQGRKAVVYPGMENTLTGADPQDVPAITDGNVTTGHGPGASFDFAFELVRLMNGEKAAKQLKEQMVFQHDSVI